MTPTNELRFVEREGKKQISKVPDKWEYTTFRILQQKWKRIRYQGEVDEFTDYEWRDVPVEKETDRDPT